MKDHIWRCNDQDTSSDFFKIVVQHRYIISIAGVAVHLECLPSTLKANLWSHGSCFTPARSAAEHNGQTRGGSRGPCNNPFPDREVPKENAFLTVSNVCRFLRLQEIATHVVEVHLICSLKQFLSCLHYILNVHFMIIENTMDLL